jgi:transposase, IS5 family
MRGKTENNPQLNIYLVPLVNVINMKHALVDLSHKIDWDAIEKDFMIYYAGTGRPAVPVRKIVGSMLLKHFYNSSDEVFLTRWIENPYWQYFCGETYFQFIKPFDQSEFGHFRKRIGKEGIEKLTVLFSEIIEKENLNIRKGHRLTPDKMLMEQNVHVKSLWLLKVLGQAQNLKSILAKR